MSTAFASQSTNVRLPDWARLVRSACLTVANNRPGLIEAVNVSQRLNAASDGDREALRKLARDLAGEYGLVAEVEDNGKSISVRLSRLDLDNAEAGAEQAPPLSDGAERSGSSAAAVRAILHTLASARRG